MAQRVRVHFKVLGFIPTSIVVEPENVITMRDASGTPHDYLIGFDDHGYPHKIDFTKITHTSIPEPLPKREPEPTPSRVMRPGWNTYE